VQKLYPLKRNLVCRQLLYLALIGTQYGPLNPK
jgi:hypothetical protein